MSTILKALRRLEQEKSAGRDRPLSEAVANAPEPPAPTESKAPRLVVTIAATAALFAAGAAVWWAIARDPAEDGAAPAAVAALPADEPAPAEARAPRPPVPPRRTTAPAVPGARPAPAVPGVPGMEADAAGAGALDADVDAAEPVRELPADALESDVAVVERPPPDPVAAESRAEAIERIAAPPARPKPGSTRPGAAALVPKPPTPRVTATEPSVRQSPPRPALPEPEPTAPPATARKSPPRPAVKPEPEPEPEPQPEPPPVVAKAPAPEPPPAPSVYVQRTRWHPRAEERVAFVEFPDRGETMELREGDAVGTLVVKTIEPSGVEFLNGGVALHRRVGAR